ncbi:TPR-like protein [Artomyces pyxidatus]|uniref:TPR-like protein n=1 Tax=Artomyces pyxidatus TaxID=48021 RepID=A0ACB8T947_9AGAM|nr:TPR-like protein [Artomyces pyxidatus]
MADINDVEQKLAIARQKKDVGDQAFKAGKVQEALRGYHESLLYLQGIDKSGVRTAFAPPVAEAGAPKEKTEADDMIEKIYANMSACHIKQENWKRAQETADKALAKNPDNYKAMFRKGKALGELGFFERAEGVLNDLVKKNPSDATVANTELSRLRAIDKERERQHNQKLKGWLNRDKTKNVVLGETPEAEHLRFKGQSKWYYMART